MSPVQYSGQGRERLIQAAAATSDANGLIAFRLGPCPLGFVWQGSVTITGAPSGALFNASVSTPWGQWAGSTNFGPVQLWGNETLTVAGVGLQKNTQYSMLFFGVAMPEDMADPLPPVAPLSTVSVETSTLLVNNAHAINAGFTDITVPTLTRRLTVVVQTAAFTATTVSVIGGTTGAPYGAGSLNNVNGAGVFFFAIEPTIDATYRVSVSGTGAINYWVTANSTNPLAITDDSHPIVIAQPITVNQQAGTQFNVSGSPVGPFKSTFRVLVTAGGGVNQQLIASPGLGSSIYLQSVAWEGAAGANNVEVHPAGAGDIVNFTSQAGGQNGQQFVYPGGYELPANAALQANPGPANAVVSGTYVTGPTV